MKTEIYKVTEDNLQNICGICAGFLRQGELVAFPTETVYGLGGNGFDSEASRKIYEAKGRPSDNPLILHIGRKEQIYELVTEVSEKAEKLIDAFWPGPLTIILNKSEKVPDTVSGGLKTVAIRFPSHPVANALLLSCDFPVAAPSANLSGKPSTTRGSHVIEDLSGRIKAIIDGGDVPIGVESTIIDLSDEIPVLLRPGFISLKELQDVIGEVKVDPAITRENIIHHTVEIEHPKAPGMKYRHYAPKAPVTIICGEEEKVIRAIKDHADPETGILTVDEHKDLYDKGIVFSVGSKHEPVMIMQNLFDRLRRFDKEAVKRIYAEDLTPYDLTGAVMNRLLKSAGGNFVNCSDFEETFKEH